MFKVGKANFIIMKKHMYNWLVIMGVALMAACGSGKKGMTSGDKPDDSKGSETTEVKDQVQDGDSVFARLRRGACFGRCPMYEVLIYQSGYATYDAKRFTDTVGFFYAHLPASKLEDIKKYANEVGYFEMEDKYDNEYVTDLPSTETRCHFDGKDKAIVNRYQGPRELRSFEQYIDDVLKDVKWIRIPSSQD